MARPSFRPGPSSPVFFQLPVNDYEEGGYTPNQDISQPGSRKWTVWDGNRDTDKETFYGTVCENMHVSLLWNDKSCDYYSKLTPILRPPFGAALTGAGLLVTLDGLRVNTDLQVLDGEGRPIPGLYAAGNASGDFFSNDYPITAIGVSHGRAFTFGWLAGQRAAASRG